MSNVYSHDFSAVRAIMHPVFGAPIGVDRRGNPVYRHAGGAARDFSSWTPIEYDPVAFGRELQASAIYAAAGTRPMTSEIVEIDRLLNADVGGGSTLTEDSNDGSKVQLPAYQFTGKATLDEAQLEDANADPIGALSYEWLNSFHIGFDNACIGVTGARSTTDTDYRPYNSLYKTVRTTDATVSYTADANYASGPLTYTTTSSTMKLVESSQYWSQSGMAWIAHPTLMDSFRNMVDDNHRPIFLSANDPTSGVTSSVLMGYPVFWTVGSRVSSTFRMTATGNPLLSFVNRHYITRGSRIEPQSRFIDARINTASTQHTVVHRSRQGFVLRVPQSASVYEITS